MNVMVYNKFKEALLALNLEVMKALEGTYNVDEIIDTFTNLYYDKMILDITAIRDYQNFDNLQKLAMNINMDNVIILLDDNMQTNSNEFISKLVSLGIYNFTKNADAINYLLVHPHTYQDVANMQGGEVNKVIEPSVVSTPSFELDTPDVIGEDLSFKSEPIKSEPVIPTPVMSMPKESETAKKSISDFEKPVNNTKVRIIGFKDSTLHAGATSLIYMLKKALQSRRQVCGIEINKVDFLYYNDRDLYSTTNYDLSNELAKKSNYDLIFIDLNDYEDTSICNEVYYLIEPSTLMINRMIKKNKSILEKLRQEKVILTKSLLSNSDLATFEYETKLKLFASIPYVDDRQDNIKPINDLIKKMNL